MFVISCWQKNEERSFFSIIACNHNIYYLKNWFIADYKLYLEKNPDGAYYAALYSIGLENNTIVSSVHLK